MKHPLASSYGTEQTDFIKSTCLLIATKFGDLIDDLVVVGGLVPTLLIPRDNLQDGEEAHVGTTDLDLGLSLGLLEEKKYENFVERLRRSGFEPDVNSSGNPSFQRWVYQISPDVKVKIDFMISPLDNEKGGSLRHIEHDFAAIVTPGLHLSFQDRVNVTLDGRLPNGGKAKRKIWICGPGAFVVLKSLAFNSRSENKDAYDLYYLIRNFGNGVGDLFKHIKPLLGDKCTQDALLILKENFTEPDHIGPVAVARFLYDANDENTQADVVGFVTEVLRACDQYY